MLAREHGWRTVPVWELVEPHAERLNPDGVHWPEEAHLAVGTAVADAMSSELAARAQTARQTTRSVSLQE